MYYFTFISSIIITSTFFYSNKKQMYILSYYIIIYGDNICIVLHENVYGIHTIPEGDDGSELTKYYTQKNLQVTKRRLEFSLLIQYRRSTLIVCSCIVVCGFALYVQFFLWVVVKWLGHYCIRFTTVVGWNESRFMALTSCFQRTNTIRTTASRRSTFACRCRWVQTPNLCGSPTARNTGWAVPGGNLDHHLGGSRVA